MDTWIDRGQFEHLTIDEPKTVKIEGGFDTFERIDIRESEDEESTVHIFKIAKETDLFEITIHWAVDTEDEDYDDDELKALVKNRVRTECSYQAAHYLKSMDLPPLQGLFAEGMMIEMIPESSDSDGS